MVVVYRTGSFCLGGSRQIFVIFRQVRAGSHRPLVFVRVAYPFSQTTGLICNDDRQQPSPAKPLSMDKDGISSSQPDHRRISVRIIRTIRVWIIRASRNRS